MKDAEAHKSDLAGGWSGRRRVRHILVPAVALGLAAALLAGCSSDGGVDTEVPVAASSPAGASTALASPTPTTGADQAVDEAAILAVYRAFFAAQTEISAAPATQRRAMLEPLAVDPLLSRVLRGMFAADGFGEVGYGVAEVDPAVTRIDGDDAEIADCQDTSNSGRKNRETGKVVTRGTPEAKVVATARRGADGTWRLATVEYRDDKC